MDERIQQSYRSFLRGETSFAEHLQQLLRAGSELAPKFLLQHLDEFHYHLVQGQVQSQVDIYQLITNTIRWLMPSTPKYGVSEAGAPFVKYSEIKINPCSCTDRKSVV